MAASSNNVAENEAETRPQSEGWFGRAFDSAFGGANAWIRTFTAYVTLITLAVGAFQKVPWPATMPLWQRIGWVCALPALVFCFHGIPVLREQRRKMRLAEIAGSLRPGYFQLAPREDEISFTRADGAHKEVLRWVERFSSQVLYLTGLSGSGKSSILAAHVVPELERKETVVISLRGYQDPVKALESELLKPKVIWQKPDPEPGGVIPLVERACRYLRSRRLVVILDQFEEFVILQQKENQKEFEQFLAALNTIQSSNFTLLLAFRSDYIGTIENLALPSLNQNTNWKEVPPFTESAARDFLQGSGLQVADNLLYDVLREAADKEQTKGFIRPITINLCGLVLSRFATGLPRRFRHGSLIRGFLRETVELREIRDVAPLLVPRLISGHVTKLPRSIDELARETGNTPAVVRGCLRVLGSNDRTIVRPLDAEQQVWEISHDFLVPLLDSIIARWKGPRSRRLREWRLWSVVAVAILIVAGIFRFQYQNRTVAQIRWFTYENEQSGMVVLSTFGNGKYDEVSMRDTEKIRHLTEPFGISLMNSGGDLVKIPDLSILNGSKYLAGFNFSNSKITDISALKDFPGLKELNLDNTRVSDISSLKGLRNLSGLGLSSTQISDIWSLKGLTDLSTLGLGYTEVTDLAPLTDLKKLSDLTLKGTPVSDLSSLKDLNGLTTLDLESTKVKNLSSLQGLASLTSLHLGHTDVSDISPLQNLKGLTELELSGTNVKDLTPLKDLKSLKILFLSDTQVDDLTPLKDLKNLTELYLIDNKVRDLTPLKDLKGLTRLFLSETKAEDITSLKDLKNLKTLYLTDTLVRDITPLKDLKDLDELDLSGTNVRDLMPLKDLKSLTDLNIGYTQVLDLSPLKNMENLKNLDLRGAKARDISPLRQLKSLTINNWL